MARKKNWVHGKKVGIWGFGIVGKAAFKYFKAAQAQIDIIDQRMLTKHEKTLAKSIGALWHQLTNPKKIVDWIKQQDYIIASPGIDLRPYAAYRHKFLSELDLFYDAFHKPIIAVTGSVGKTTIVSLLNHLIRARYPHVWTGGNIGISMLDALNNKSIDAALLEVSSFQLEQSTFFAPDLAIWTNFYPNHLDRHETLQAYFAAKQQMILQQQHNQHALVPLSLLPHFNKHQGHIHTFSLQNEEINTPTTSKWFTISNEHIIVREQRKEQKLIALNSLPDITFMQNWLIICAALHLLDIPLTNIASQIGNLQLPAHRLEYVGIFNGIDVYNDSKATTAAATLAAVEKFHTRPIILILGGLSKGVNRSDLIKQVQGKVKAVICFGKEHAELANTCRNYAIPCQGIYTLEDAVQASFRIANPGDQLLFSPAGSSFDQFKNYEERGEQFKSLIHDYVSQSD